jgi:hypothetical protein
MITPLQTLVGAPLVAVVIGAALVQTLFVVMKPRVQSAMRVHFAAAAALSVDFVLLHAMLQVFTFYYFCLRAHPPCSSSSSNYAFAWSGTTGDVDCCLDHVLSSMEDKWAIGNMFNVVGTAPNQVTRGTVLIALLALSALASAQSFLVIVCSSAAACYDASAQNKKSHYKTFEVCLLAAYTASAIYITLRAINPTSEIARIAGLVVFAAVSTSALLWTFAYFVLRDARKHAANHQSPADKYTKLVGVDDSVLCAV